MELPVTSPSWGLTCYLMDQNFTFQPQSILLGKAFHDFGGF